MIKLSENKAISNEIIQLCPKNDLININFVQNFANKKTAFVLSEYIHIL